MEWQSDHRGINRGKGNRKRKMMKNKLRGLISVSEKAMKTFRGYNEIQWRNETEKFKK